MTSNGDPPSAAETVCRQNKSGRTTVRPFTSMIVLMEISKTSSRHLAAAVPVVVAAGAGAGFLVAGAAGFAVAGTACLCEVLLTTAAVVG